MKTNEFESIPFMERKNFVRQSVLMYLKVKNITKELTDKNLESGIDIKKYDPVSVFENIIKLLNENEQLIIEKDFIEETQRGNWYLDHWSKTSYYKYKHDAVNKFLYLFFS